MTATNLRPSLEFREAGVPASLKKLERWCVWRYEGREGGATKIPVNARTGGRAMSNNKSTWATYEEAHAAYLADPTLAGLGFFLGEGFVGVDVDDCNDHLDGLSELGREVLNTVAGYAEYSPSGEGLKIITLGSLPSSRTDRRIRLEVYDRTRFFAVTGHTINREPNDLPAVPLDLSEFYAKHFGAYTGPSADDEDLSALIHAKGPLAGWDIDRVREKLLDELDPEPMHHNDWLEVGTALHHQGEGDADWLELWDAWSARDPERYAAGVCETRWDSFGKPAGGKLVTLATVIHRVKQALASKKYEREAHWTTLIAAATDKVKLQEEIPGQIARDLGVDAKVREELAQLLKRRIKALFNTSQPIGAVRGWLKPVISHDQGNMPVWLKPYVYVADEERYFQTERRMRFTRESFNAKHNRDMPVNDSGDPVKPAAAGATDMYGIPVVDSALYQPALATFFTFDGRECVNTYDDGQIPPMPPVLLDDEEAAVALVQEHLSRMLPDERERRLFTNWMAWVVQNPGKKLRWSPYLCGVPGDGKSFFGTMLGFVVGARNYRSLSGDMLKQAYTDWAVGTCVTLIEEVKLHGSDKFDAVNKLKPFVTNDVVDVRPMYRAPYNAPNTTNYLIASNYLDGMPITDDDRRFMFLVSNFSSAALAAFNAADPEFYSRLFRAIDLYPGAIRFWLMHERNWHPDFKPDGKAPITKARGLVIEMSESDADAACRTVFDSRPGGVTDSWVAVKAFSLAVAAELGPRSNYTAAQIGRICADFLRAKGYRYMGGRHRVGPSIQSAMWLHELSKLNEGDLLNWWEIAEPVIKKSFADAAAGGFLT